MIETDSKQPLLQDCPSCGYSLAKQPPEHVCPECAFRFNRNSVVVSENRRGYLMSAIFAIVYIGPAIYFGIKSQLMAAYALMIWFMLAGIFLNIRRWKRPAQFVVVSNKDIRFVKRDRTEECVTLADVHRASWSRINGYVTLWGDNECVLHTLSGSFWNSHKTARLAVAAINTRVAELSS